MGHVSYPAKGEAAEALRPTYDDVEKKLGVMLNFFKVMAHSPDLLPAFLGLDRALHRTALDPQLRELAYLKASQMNGCEYCLHYHRQLGRKAGLSAEQMEGVGDFEENPAYDERQRAVLLYAEAVTRTTHADDALVVHLKEFLSERELVELTATIALANFTNRMNDALKIDLP